MKKKEVVVKNKLNHQIENKSIRIIKSDSLDGVYSKSEAINLALKDGNDLIEVSSNNNVSICVIMDYSKFCYKQKKTEKEKSKNNKKIEQKELRFTPNIGENDLNIKIKKAGKFILDGNDVKISVYFSGREMSYTEHGKIVIAKVIHALQEHSKIKSDISMNGRNMTVIIGPK